MLDKYQKTQTYYIPIHPHQYEQSFNIDMNMNMHMTTHSPWQIIALLASNSGTLGQHTSRFR